MADTHSVPVLAVLLLAGLIIADLAVEEKNDKVDEVEVGQGCFKTGREAPSEAKLLVS